MCFTESARAAIIQAMNLILIGYRATGKTTLAQRLAEHLDWEWIDADVEIERRAGKTIARMFAEDGEPAFRDLEADVIAELCGRERLVLATGGGAPLRPESRQAMRGAGHVIWLTANVDTILKRMMGDATTADRRPSLTKLPPREEIVAVLERREPIYGEAAHFVVDTENRPPEDLVAEIIRLTNLPVSRVACDEISDRVRSNAAKPGLIS